MWIAPAHLDAETRDVLERDELAAYVDLFHADYLAFGDWSELVARWWDLEAARGLYDEFLDGVPPGARQLAPTPDDALADGGGVRRLRPRADRVAAAAVPRPGTARRGAPAPAGAAPRPPTCSSTCATSWPIRPMQFVARRCV